MTTQQRKKRKVTSGVKSQRTRPMMWGALVTQLLETKSAVFPNTKGALLTSEQFLLVLQSQLRAMGSPLLTIQAAQCEKAGDDTGSFTLTLGFIPNPKPESGV